MLSLSTVRSLLKQLRDFFGWLAIHPQYIRKIDARAAAYLRLSNNAERAGRATRELPVPTVEEIHLVLETMPYGTQIEKRDRAIKLNQLAFYITKYGKARMKHPFFQLFYVSFHAV